MQTGTEADIDDIGFFRPADDRRSRSCDAGEVGYVITGIKDVAQAARRRHADRPREPGADEPLPGYREVKPMVFCGLFPIDTDHYEDLRDALEKLALNDAALTWEPETSDALGFGFRCGFLGLLHMDIVRERLEREYDLELLATTPNVGYEVDAHQRRRWSRSTARPTCPTRRVIEEIREPYIRATIITPDRVRRRGDGALPGAPRRRTSGMHYLSSERVQLTYDLPLAEIVLDFFDQLKSRTRGYASLDYELDRHAGRRTSSSSTCCSPATRSTRSR